MRTISTVDDRTPPSLEPSDGPLVDGPPLHVPAGSMAPISDFFAAGEFVPTLPHVKCVCMSSVRRDRYHDW